MDTYTINGSQNALAQYETPFADLPQINEYEQQPDVVFENSVLSQFESPFAETFEPQTPISNSPIAGEYVDLLSELHDDEFTNTLYELASEMSDTWSEKISNEAALGNRYIPFVTQQANEYIMPLAMQTEAMLETVKQHFSGDNLADHNEAELEAFFQQLSFNHSQFTPAQEDFFGKIFNKVKSIVKKGVDLAKKGISAVGKILPINLILGKLKGLIRPLLDKVLRFAIGKLPKNLQSHAKTLAKKFLNLETAGEATSMALETPATGDLDAIQTEFDNQAAKIVFSSSEAEADEEVLSYETSFQDLDREAAYAPNSMTAPTLDTARQEFIQMLKELQPGQSAAPSIQQFIPVAIMALQPVIKTAIGIIGRQRVIDFLAGLLAQLVAKYVPAEVAKPLASKIIDIGMSTIGFEMNERNQSDLAYEAIANTIEATIQNIGHLNETVLNDQELLTAELLQAFESAAAANFPQEYLKEELRTALQPGVWVLKPRTGSRRWYKKYSHVFTVTIDPQTARSIKTFRGIPLSNFLRDKYGLDANKSVQARIHVFEAIEGTWLSMIAKYENIPGLGTTKNKAWVQFHPLSKQAAALLLKAPTLGKDFSAQYTNKRPRIAVGQRFYFIEMGGTRLRIPSVDRSKHGHVEGKAPSASIPGQSSDIQAVINFVRSEIRLNYFFSEEEAKSVVEKLNRNDYLGAALTIRSSVRTVLNGILVQNIGSKVRIVHEAMPELYLDNFTPDEENFAPFSAIGALAKSAGKEMLSKIIEKLVEKLAEMAYQAIVNYFKARAAEFKQAHAQPQDGVTLKVIWINIPGMSSIRAIINAVKGNLSLGNLADLALPNIPTPDIQIKAGKYFD